MIFIIFKNGQMFCQWAIIIAHSQHDDHVHQHDQHTHLRTAPTLTVTSFTGKMHQPHWLANSVSVLAWRGVGCEGC